LSKSQRAQSIIRDLGSKDLKFACSNCEEDFPLKQAGLFYLDNFSDNARELYDEMRKDQRSREKALAQKRKKISQKSLTAAQSINLGFIFERLAPTLKAFRFSKNDCRPLFDPIDYVIFDGLSKSGTVDRIFFTDIKSGACPLKGSQKEVKECVEKKKVDFDTYRGGKQQ